MLEATTSVTDTSTTSASPSAPTDTQPVPSAQPAPEVTPPVQEAAMAPGMEAAPAFTPDWKFKVKDKEYEIDEFLRGAIKDEESYKKIKRMYERSHGLDEVLSSRDQLKAQFEATQPTVKEYNQIVKSLNEISHHYNSGDLDSFFAKLQIPFDVIFNYVRSKHEQSQLPAEVQRELENARQARAEAYNYQQRLKELETSASQTEFNNKIQYLDSVISSKAGDVAQKFNEAQGGNPEAFRNYVIFRAQQLSQMAGRNVTPEEAVDRVREDIARLSGVQAAPAQPAQPGPVASGKPPVIPNVKAGAQSPVRQPPKSLEELRNIARHA